MTVNSAGICLRVVFSTSIISKRPVVTWFEWEPGFLEPSPVHFSNSSNRWVYKTDRQDRDTMLGLIGLPDVPGPFQLFRWARCCLTIMTHKPSSALARLHPGYTAVITSAICDSPDLCRPHTNTAAFQPACSCAACVYRLEECTVFGNVKSSPRWSELVQTHSVLLDGPEIPLRAPSVESEHFNILCLCWGLHANGF